MKLHHIQGNNRVSFLDFVRNIAISQYKILAPSKKVAGMGYFVDKLLLKGC